MAIIGRPAGSAGLPRRHHRPAGLDEPPTRSGVGQAQSVLRRDRRQHGFAGQPLHLGPAHPHNDAYTPEGAAGKRPDRAVLVYSQRCREAYREAPIVIGGIEASLRRIAQYDHWSEKVRRSILVDAKADILLYGNAERAIVEIAHRAAKGEPVREIRDIRGTAYLVDRVPETYKRAVARPGRRGGAGMGPRHQSLAGVRHRPGRSPRRTPFPTRSFPTTGSTSTRPASAGRRKEPSSSAAGPIWRNTVVRLPAFEQVQADRILYAPRLAHPPPGEQSRECPRPGAAPRRQGAVADPAADPALHAGDGRGLRPALCAGAAPILRRCEDPRLGHDPLLGQHHARLLWRLLLLLDHRA